MYLHTPALEVGSWWRVDTASGSDTATTVYAHDGTDAIPTALGTSGSTVRGNSPDGTARFWSATATLYCKELTYQGAPTGTVVTSTGSTPAAPGTTVPVDIATISTLVAALPTTYVKLLVTDATSTTLTGTLAAGHLSPVDCTAGSGARTLPAASSVAAGTPTVAKKADTSANALVVSRAGSDLIFGTGAGATSKTLSLAGEAVTLVSNGVDRWSIESSDTPSGSLAATYAHWDGSNLTQGGVTLTVGAFADRGTWTTATAYVVGDVVTDAASLRVRYICRTAHTSGVFATDVAASDWVLIDAVSASPVLSDAGIKTGNTTAGQDQVVRVDTTSGNVTITLPAAPTTKSQVVVKHVTQGFTSGTANKVTVACGGSDVLNKPGGDTSIVLSLLGQSVTLLYLSSTAVWVILANDLPLTQIDPRYDSYGLAVGRGTAVVPVSPRAHAAFDNATSVAVGATGGVTYELFYPLIDPAITSVLPVFGNWIAQNGFASGDLDATQAVTISAAVKNSDSTIVPFTFNGSHTVTMTPKTAAFAIPDLPVAFDKQVSANDKFSVAISLTGVWLRMRVDPVDTSRTDTCGITSASATVTDTSCVAGDAGKLVTGTGIPSNTYVGTVTASTSFTLVNGPGSATTVNATATNASASLTITATIPSNASPYASSDNFTTQNATDLTLPGSGNVSGGSGSNYYGPVALLGRTKLRKPIVALISDSILDGYSEDFHSAYWGPVARACLALSLPFVKFSRGGETALAWTTAIGRRYRTTLLEGCTHAIVQTGTNDGILNGTSGVTTMTTRLTTIGTMLNSLGIKGYLSTIPPRTTSTDSWATTGNQTPVSGSAIVHVASMNTAIRAGISPYQSTIYDLADDCMSARDSGLWAASATTDGVHPSDTLMRGTVSTHIQTLVATFTL